MFSFCSLFYPFYHASRFTFSPHLSCSGLAELCILLICCSAIFWRWRLIFTVHALQRPCSSPPTISIHLLLPWLLLTNPTSSLPLSSTLPSPPHSFYFSWSLCITLCSYYLRLIPSSTSYQSLMIRPHTQTHTYTLNLLYFFHPSSLTFVALYFTYPLYIMIRNNPSMVCVWKRLCSIPLTHAGTHTWIVVLAFLSCQTHPWLAQPEPKLCISKHVLIHKYIFK